jgi:hypothetical protein
MPISPINIACPVCGFAIYAGEAYFVVQGTACCSRCAKELRGRR